VEYAYPDGHLVFRNLNLHIPSEQRVGIVGPSGAGKSRLLALLQRLDDVRGGGILVDDQPVTGLTRDSLSQAVAVVPQEILLFRRTGGRIVEDGPPDVLRARDGLFHALWQMQIRENPLEHLSA
jgi:ATP-binding cassette subfamily B protein